MEEKQKKNTQNTTFERASAWKINSDVKLFSLTQTFLAATTHLPTPQLRSLIKSPSLAQQAPPPAAHSPDNGARIC